MKKLIVLLLTLIMVTSTSALVEMFSDAEVKFEPKNLGHCHFELGKGTICPDSSQRSDNYFRGDSMDECYFDRVYGATCPDIKPSQGVFYSDRIESAREFNTRRYVAPQRISAGPPMTITGDFKPRFEQRQYYRARLAYMGAGN